MKKKIQRLILFIAGIAFYRCTPQLIPPTEADAERAKAFGTTLVSLQQGHTLYLNKCGTCHSLKLPPSESEESWKKIVPPMAKKAKLNTEEQDLILRYILSVREAKK